MNAAPPWIWFLLVPATCSALAALVGTALAARVGWVDGGSGEHKRAGDDCPLSGGPALLVGALSVWALLALWGRESAPFVPGRELASLLGTHLGRDVSLWPFGALLTAFAVGAIDDGLRDGLGPALKLVGQLATGVVLAAPLLFGADSTPAAVATGLVLVVATAATLNLVNTFDHADGAALSVGLLGLSASALPFAAAVAALAPFNLRRDARTSWGRKAILGDSGSHTLGVLVLITPLAWPALILPALDLARVCLERVRIGAPLWRGDRRHLAHRLAASGRSNLRVALALAWIGAPAPLAALAHPLWGAALGGVATALAFAVALRRAPAQPEAPALDVRTAVGRPAR